MGANELPTFSAVIAAAVIVIGVIVAMAAITRVFLLAKPQYLAGLQLVKLKD